MPHVTCLEALFRHQKKNFPWKRLLCRFAKAWVKKQIPKELFIYPYKKHLFKSILLGAIN